MESKVLNVSTGSRPATVDITADTADFCRGKGDGLLSVFVPHATAGVAIFETGARSEEDLIDTIEDMFPRSRRYRHSHGSPGHGRDHVLPAFLSPSLTVPVVDGTMVLGTWQSIVLVDTNIDNETRRVRLSFLPG